MSTYTYELLKWTRDNNEALAAYGTRFPELKAALDAILSVERNFTGDLEALKDASRGVNSSFLDALSTGVFAFAVVVHLKRAEILKGDDSTLRDVSGLALNVFSNLRMDILGLASNPLGRKGATLHFDRYGLMWTVKLEAGCASPVFKLGCLSAPEAVGSFNLREQLDWLKADEDETYRRIDAIIEDPANWPTEDQRREAEHKRLDELAEKVVWMMTSQDRELAHREAGEFSQRVAALLAKTTSKH